MPRKPGRVPSYCLHKASGRAVVRIGGQDHYLGAYGSDESYAAYERLVSEYRSERQRSISEKLELASTVNLSLTVTEAIWRYREFASGYYSLNGHPTKELVEMRLALRPLRELYGETLAREFGPLKLKAVRQHMIEKGLSRGVINNRVNRIKRFFKWAVSEQLIPPSVYEGLRALSGMRKGRTTARETDPVMPVDDTHVVLCVVRYIDVKSAVPEQVC